MLEQTCLITIIIIRVVSTSLCQESALPAFELFFQPKRECGSIIDVFLGEMQNRNGSLLDLLFFSLKCD
jgi:hypothetical protein